MCDLRSEDESLWVEFRNCKGQLTLMAVIHKPPNSSWNVDYRLQREIEKACQKGNFMIVTGDFNIQVDWENHVGKGSQENELVECLRDSIF